ncbi:MAG: isomerase, partial [Paracoccaceae bacterium]|nr:isomerase [Paracoccaceae bacterium]
IDRFRACAAQVGHVQIASVPARAEPETGPGAVPDYGVILPALRKAGYGGMFGCEYRPATTTDAGLGWRAAVARGA